MWLSKGENFDSGDDDMLRNDQYEHKDNFKDGDDIRIPNIVGVQVVCKQPYSPTWFKSLAFNGI